MPRSKNVPDRLSCYLALCLVIAGALLLPFMARAQAGFEPVPLQPAPLQPGVRRNIEPVDIAPLNPGLNSGAGDWSAQGVGVLDPGAGGMGLDLWNGANAAIVYQALTALPADLASATVRQALETALLSTARPPAANADLPLAGRDFIAVRANTLQRLGLSASATRLLRAAGGMGIENRAAVLAEATLRQGLVQDACDWAKTYSAPAPDRMANLAAFWTRMNVLCAVANGDADKARFLTALAVEQGQVDSVFDQLVNAATAQPPADLPGTEQANRLTLPRPVMDMVEIALSDRARITAPLPADFLLRVNMLENQAPMLPVTEQGLRLRHALALARAGVMDRGGLDAVMASAGVTTVLDADPLAAARAAPYDNGLLILAAALGRDTTGTDYPALWQEMAQMVRPWRGAVLGRVAAWLDNITPANGLQTDLNQIASTAALVRMAEGKVVEASRWLTLAPPEQANKTRLQLVPFEWLDQRFSAVSAEAWLADAVADSRLGPNYAQLALHLASASESVPEASIQPLLDSINQNTTVPPSPLNQQDALLMMALEQVAGQQQKGMSLLLVAQGIGNSDPALIESGRMVAMVRALSRAGLQPVAWQLAREVLIGRLAPSVAPPPVIAASPAKPVEAPKKQSAKPAKLTSKEGAKKP